jgi:uncharacterized protein with PIN domain
MEALLNSDSEGRIYEKDHKTRRAFFLLRRDEHSRRKVTVPDGNQTIHLQFRSFAGCPVCNLHLQSFVRRHEEIREVGVREVVGETTRNGK